MEDLRQTDSPPVSGSREAESPERGHQPQPRDRRGGDRDKRQSRHSRHGTKSDRRSHMGSTVITDMVVGSGVQRHTDRKDYAADRLKKLGGGRTSHTAAPVARRQSSAEVERPTPVDSGTPVSAATELRSRQFKQIMEKQYGNDGGGGDVYGGRIRKFRRRLSAEGGEPRPRTSTDTERTGSGGVVSFASDTRDVEEAHDDEGTGHTRRISLSRYKTVANPDRLGLLATVENEQNDEAKEAQVKRQDSGKTKDWMRTWGSKNPGHRPFVLDLFSHRDREDTGDVEKSEKPEVGTEKVKERPAVRQFFHGLKERIVRPGGSSAGLHFSPSEDRQRHSIDDSALHRETRFSTDLPESEARMSTDELLYRGREQGQGIRRLRSEMSKISSVAETLDLAEDPTTRKLSSVHRLTWAGGRSPIAGDMSRVSRAREPSEGDVSALTSVESVPEYSSSGAEHVNTMSSVDGPPASVAQHMIRKKKDKKKGARKSLDEVRSRTSSGAESLKDSLKEALSGLAPFLSKAASDSADVADGSQEQQSEDLGKASNIPVPPPMPVRILSPPQPPRLSSGLSLTQALTRLRGARSEIFGRGRVDSEKSSEAGTETNSEGVGRRKESSWGGALVDGRRLALAFDEGDRRESLEDVALSDNESMEVPDFVTSSDLDGVKAEIEQHLSKHVQEMMAALDALRASSQSIEGQLADVNDRLQVLEAARQASDEMHEKKWGEIEGQFLKAAQRHDASEAGIAKLGEDIAKATEERFSVIRKVNNLDRRIEEEIKPMFQTYDSQIQSIQRQIDELPKPKRGLFTRLSEAFQRASVKPSLWLGKMCWDGVSFVFLPTASQRLRRAPHLFPLSRSVLAHSIGEHAAFSPHVVERDGEGNTRRRGLTEDRAGSPFQMVRRSMSASSPSRPTQSE